MSPRVLSHDDASVDHTQHGTIPPTAEITARVIRAGAAHPFYDKPVTAEERVRVFTAGVALVRQWLPASRGPTTDRSDAERVVRRLLDHLDTFPGHTYQQRWYASGADAAGKNWLPPYADGPSRRLGARQALNALLMLGVLRPSIAWLLECKQARF